MTDDSRSFGTRSARAACAVVALLACTSCAGVFTHAFNSERTAWYPDQTRLTPQLVSGGTFGQMFEAPVDGQVYAQPVIAGGIVVVATEKNNIYGIDATTGERKWSRNVGIPWNPDAIGCADLAPSVGITGTPVIDAWSKTAYFFNKTYASASSGPAAWWMHAVDITTGAERSGFPVRIQGNAANVPAKTFTPTTQLQRTGLLLLDGVVYAGFGGHCDRYPYSGWVVGVTTAGAITTMWTSSPAVPKAGAGIWQSAGGLMSDGPGSIYLATGNGSTNVTPRPGSHPGTSLGQAVVHLRVQPDRSLRPVDFFSPYDADTLDTWDADLASGSPVLLPATPFSTPSHRRLIAIIGKQGYLYLLDAGDLGGMRQGTNGGDRVVARLGPMGNMWGQTAVWPGDGGYVYVLPPAGYLGDGVLRAWKWSVGALGTPTLVEAGRANEPAGFGSSAAVVTSQGTTSGSALLWVSARDAFGNGQLRAYDAVPANGKLRLRWSGSTGRATKFSIPAVFGDRVYVGTEDGRLLSFGSPVATPLTGGPLAIPYTTVGDQHTATLTMRASTDLNISAITTSSAGFSVGTATSADPPQTGLPLSLPAGKNVNVPVTFAPGSPGAASGEVTFSTSVGNVAVPVTSFGINPTGLLEATPRVISFGGAAAGGTPVTLSASIANVGATDVTINSIDLPAAPFAVSGLPAAGAVIPSLASVVVTGTFSPAVVGSWEDVLTLHTSAGDLDLPMSGTAAPPPVMALTPTTVAFGPTLVGGVASRSFTIKNTGGSGLLITKSKPPAGGTGFNATTSLPEATVIAPGATVTENVAFAPTATGNRSDTWTINGNDGGGERAITFTGNGVTGTSATGPPGNSWSLNGAAKQDNEWLELTDIASSARGSSFAPQPVSASSMVVSFDSVIGYGNGADGLALVFGDVSRGAPATSLGTAGGGLGFGGIPGIAVALDEFQNAGDPFVHSIGITDGLVGADPNQLRWLASVDVPVRNGHHIDVSIADGFVVVRIDGLAVLAKGGIAIPSTFRLGFTGANGGLVDLHRVKNVSVRYQA